MQQWGGCRILSLLVNWKGSVKNTRSPPTPCSPDVRWLVATCAIHHCKHTASWPPHPPGCPKFDIMTSILLLHIKCIYQQTNTSKKLCIITLILCADNSILLDCCQYQCNVKIWELYYSPLELHPLQLLRNYLAWQNSGMLQGGFKNVSTSEFMRKVFF